MEKIRLLNRSINQLTRDITFLTHNGVKIVITQKMMTESQYFDKILKLKKLRRDAQVERSTLRGTASTGNFNNRVKRISEI